MSEVGARGERMKSERRRASIRASGGGRMREGGGENNGEGEGEECRRVGERQSVN